MRWEELFNEAVGKKGVTQVGLDLGYDKSTISQVANGKYAGSTDKIAQKVLDGYKRNGQGHLVPVEAIKEIDLLRDTFVVEALRMAFEVKAVLAAFKRELVDDFGAFLEISAEKYGAKMGGVKGNVTLASFDGRYQILRAVADQITFDERLQAAKALIDDCLRSWTRDSDPKIRALIDQAFQVDKKGRVNAKRILGLRSLKIDDAQWLQAMEAIGDAVQIVGSCTYYRFYERDANGNYQQITLDFSGV